MTPMTAAPLTAPWRRFEEEAPELARFVRRRFEQHTLGFLATLRADGAPRISGIEPWFSRGQLLLGMMPGSLKAADLLRDPRLALHSASIDKDVAQGDVKLNGLAVPAAPEDFAALSEATDGDHEPGGTSLFKVELTLVSSLRIGEPADHLVIESWRPGEEVTTRQRR
jgi:hypothetical protein